jgi:hypothetical protein
MDQIIALRPAPHSTDIAENTIRIRPPASPVLEKRFDNLSRA